MELFGFVFAPSGGTASISATADLRFWPKSGFAAGFVPLAGLLKCGNETAVPLRLLPTGVLALRSV